jgi:hypothetical protein
MKTTAALDARRERGRRLRKTVARTAHAALGALDRDPVALLEASARGRLAGLLPLHHERMAASPFAFFRGSAVLQAHDLAGAPRTGLGQQICGGGHLMDFGGFAAPERQIVFDLSDFDETHPGPWEWDVKHLAAKARRQTGERLLPTIAHKVDGRWTMDDAPPTLFHVHGVGTLFEPDDDWMRLGEPGRLSAALFDAYLATLSPSHRALLGRFRMHDLAFKVVGVGSVGLRCLMLLLVDDQERPLLLQIKEAVRSVLAPHLRPARSSCIPSRSRRLLHRLSAFPAPCGT